jgi:hypothetical protein
MVHFLMMTTSISPSQSQKTVAMIFPAEGVALNVFFLGEFADAAPLIVSSIRVSK